MKNLTPVFVLIAIFTIFAASSCQANQDVIKLGIIGLDTSHSPAFAKFINDPESNTGCKVIAAFPGGSPDIESSITRVPGYTQKFQEMGIEIVDSIDELIKKVDGVLLESVDGRPHLAQATPVIKAGIPLYIDKPFAGNLKDALLIFDMAKKHNVPVWSSSSLRFTDGMTAILADQQNTVGDITGCDAYSPSPAEEHHPDLYWYGIHGVETLYTAMGTGCQTVQRFSTDSTELVVGIWENGRIGTFRGIKEGKRGYGATVFGSKNIAEAGTYSGYKPLVDRIVKYFKTGEVKVPEADTIEIMAFMTAADISKQNNGKPVNVQELIKSTKKDLGIK
jgi:predicted dehydrogenase